MKKILVIGCARTEIINHVVSLPKGNEEIQSLSTEQNIGGNGFNFAYILQSFGFPYELIAPVGTGVYGDYVREAGKEMGIDLANTSQMINGCAYKMIDNNGQSSLFIVPGGEYAFDREYLQMLDPDDISGIMIFSEMLNTETGLDLLEAVGEFEKPVAVAVDNDGLDIDFVVKNAVYALNPSLILQDTDLYYLLGEKEMSLEEAASELHNETDAPVFILQEKTGCYLYDDGEDQLYSSSYSISAPLFASFLMAAEAAGANRREAVLYALQAGRDMPHTLYDSEFMKLEKNRLIEVIKHK